MSSTVDPNRFAGPAEAVLLREHIADESSNLKRVDARLECARRALNDAELALRAAQEAADSARAIVAQGEAHSNALRTSIGHARGLLHPIRRVPDEILAHIFLEWLASVAATGSVDDREFQWIPYACASVCRQWRRVALSTPFLWTHVSLSFLPIEQTSDPWIRFLQLHNERSGTLRLHMHLTTWTCDSAYTDSFYPIWRLLMMMTRRCRSLTVLCMHGLQDPRLMVLLQGRAPVLEHLELVSSGSRSSGPIQIFDDLPCLNSLHVDGFSIMWDKGRQFSGVKKLFLARDPEGIDVPHLAHVANRVPNAEELIFDDDLAVVPGPDEVCFPRVRRLELTGTMGEDAAACLRFPVLDAAVLSRMLWPAMVVSPCLAAHSANLAKLYLVRANLTLSLANAVALLPRLQELEAAACSVSDAFFHRLAQPDAGGAWPCPLLRRMHVTEALPNDRETFDGSSLLALVKARHAAASDDAVATLCDVKATWDKEMDYSKEGFRDELHRLIS